MGGGGGVVRGFTWRACVLEWVSRFVAFACFHLLNAHGVCARLLSVLSTQEKAEADAAEAAAAATTAREREAERILKEMRSFEVRVETTRHSLATSKARLPLS